MRGARYAEMLRGHGIDADATPRHSRGVVRKPLNRADYYHGRRGQLSRKEAYHFRMKLEEMQGKREGRTEPWRKAIARRFEAVASIYRLAADEMSRSADAVDRQLGSRLVGYADRMQTRPARTRDDIYAERIREAVRSQRAPVNRPAAGRVNPGRTLEKGDNRLEDIKAVVQVAMLRKVGRLPPDSLEAARFLDQVTPAPRKEKDVIAALVGKSADTRLAAKVEAVAREVQPLVKAYLDQQNDRDANEQGQSRGTGALMRFFSETTSRFLLGHFVNGES